MYLSEQIVRKILKHLEAGKVIADVKKTAGYNLKEIKYAIKELNQEDSTFYDPVFYNEVIEREKKYGMEQEKLRCIALEVLAKTGSIEEVKKETGLSITEINNTLKKIEKENLEYYKKIESKMNEFEQSKKEAEANLDKDIIDMILQGILTSEITKKLHVSKGRIKKAIEKLNTPETQEEYQKVTAAQKEVVAQNRLNSRFNYDSEKATMLIAILIITNKIPIVHAAMQMSIKPTVLASELKAISDVQLKEKLLPFIEDFDKIFILNQTENPKKLTGYSKKIQYDIIQTALTFRVPMEWMCGLFKTTVDELYMLYKSFDEIENNIWESLLYLNYEVRGEENRLCKLAYQRATAYWLERNKLLKENNKEKLNIHHQKIDDTIVLNAIQKKITELTIEEKDAIVRYRLKYALSITKCVEILHLAKETIRTFEQDLASRDLVYASKLEKLNEYFEEKNQRVSLAAQKRKEELLAFDFISTEPINLKYFNFTIGPDTSLEIVEENHSRGGGTR